MKNRLLLNPLQRLKTTCLNRPSLFASFVMVSARDISSLLDHKKTKKSKPVGE